MHFAISIFLNNQRRIINSKLRYQLLILAAILDLIVVLTQITNKKPQEEPEEQDGHSLMFLLSKTIVIVSP